MRFAADTLDKAGIELVLEPINDVDIPGFVMPAAPHAARIIQKTGSRNLGLQCDIYHTAMMGDDPTALVGLPLIALSSMLRAEGFEVP